jgi:hypothetical protein
LLPHLRRIVETDRDHEPHEVDSHG